YRDSKKKQRRLPLRCEQSPKKRKYTSAEERAAHPVRYRPDTSSVIAGMAFISSIDTLNQRASGQAIKPRCTVMPNLNADSKSHTEQHRQYLLDPPEVAVFMPCYV